MARTPFFADLLLPPFPGDAGVFGLFDADRLQRVLHLGSFGLLLASHRNQRPRPPGVHPQGVGAGDVWAWRPPIELWLSGVIAPPGGSQHSQHPRSAISHSHPWPKEGMVNLSWILCCLHLHHPHVQGEAFHLADESVCVFACIEEEYDRAMERSSPKFLPRFSWWT